VRRAEVCAVRRVAREAGPGQPIERGAEDCGQEFSLGGTSSPRRIRKDGENRAAILPEAENPCRRPSGMSARRPEAAASSCLDARHLCQRQDAIRRRCRTATDGEGATAPQPDPMLGRVRGSRALASVLQRDRLRPRHGTGFTSTMPKAAAGVARVGNSIRGRFRRSCRRSPNPFHPSGRKKAEGRRAAWPL